MPDPKDTSKTQRLKKILWESTINAPIRGAYNLMNTPYDVLMGEDSPAKRKAVEDSFDAASGVTVGSAAAPKPRGAITMGANRRGGGGSAPRSAKKAGGKAGGTSAPSGSSAAPQAGRASGGTSAPGGARSTAQSGPKSSGTSAPIGARSTAQAGRKSGGTSAPGGSAGRPQAGRKSGSAKPPGKSAATGATRTFGGKMKAGAAAGAGLLGYASYRSADKPSANVGMREAPRKEAPRDDRASSKSDKAAAFKALQQGMKTPGSPTNPNKAMAKKTGDKSRLAKPEKKFSNFERMKQRQYEKEGFGGRSMTSSRAKERVKTERGFKFKDLFKKK